MPKWLEWAGQGITIAGAFFTAVAILTRTVGKQLLIDMLDDIYQRKTDATVSHERVTEAIEELRCHMDDRHDSASERIDEFKKELREDLRDIRNKLMGRGHGQ